MSEVRDTPYEFTTTTGGPMVPYAPTVQPIPGVAQPVRAGLVYSRMCDAMEDVRAVGKDRTNEFHRYKFRGIDDVLTAMHPILAKHRLIMVPGEIVGEPKVVERDTTKGKAELHIVVRVRWHLVTDDGSYMVFETLGEASDTGDKGCNKAMSASQKYAFIQAFSIPVEESGLDTENRSPEFAAKSKIQQFRDGARANGGTVQGRATPPAAPEPPDPNPDDPTPAALATKLVLGLTEVVSKPHLANWQKKHKADLEWLRAQSLDDFRRVMVAHGEAEKRAKG